MLAFTKQAVHGELIADYDDIADALYVSLGDARPSEGRSVGNGIVVRYPLNDPENASGVVIRHFVTNGWTSDLAKLATLIADLLSVDLGQVFFALRAYRDRNPPAASARVR